VLGGRDVEPVPPPAAPLVRVLTVVELGLCGALDPGTGRTPLLRVRTPGDGWCCGALGTAPPPVPLARVRGAGAAEPAEAVRTPLERVRVTDAARSGRGRPPGPAVATWWGLARR
jgi:hypothetical protein